ncbi:MAG: hypothetical protein WAN43_19495 [Rhodomicrobium sp.]
MSRAVQAFILATIFLSPAYAEETQPARWSIATMIPRGAAPNWPVIKVQEPYCDYGVGVCGGSCGEDGGKRWDCAATELPCYTLGHCKCEAAAMCKPAPPKKKK